MKATSTYSQLVKSPYSVHHNLTFGRQLEVSETQYPLANLQCPAEVDIRWWWPAAAVNRGCCINHWYPALPGVIWWKHKVSRAPLADSRCPSESGKRTLGWMARDFFFLQEFCRCAKNVRVVELGRLPLRLQKKALEAGHCALERAVCEILSGARSAAESPRNWRIQEWETSEESRRQWAEPMKRKDYHPQCHGGKAAQTIMIFTFQHNLSRAQSQI